MHLSRTRLSFLVLMKIYVVTISKAFGYIGLGNQIFATQIKLPIDECWWTVNTKGWGLQMTKWKQEKYTVKVRGSQNKSTTGFSQVCLCVQWQIRIVIYFHDIHNCMYQADIWTQLELGSLQCIYRVMWYFCICFQQYWFSCRKSWDDKIMAFSFFSQVNYNFLSNPAVIQRAKSVTSSNF